MRGAARQAPGARKQELDNVTGFPDAWRLALGARGGH